MGKSKIRHIALFARDPAKVAKFYVDAFDMEIINAASPQGAHFLSDGYITLAVLPHNLKSQAPVGLNHFGFKVEDRVEACQRVEAASGVAPAERPDDRGYAEFRAVDPEGNWFDISQHGFERVETPAERRTRTKVPA